MIEQFKYYKAKINYHRTDDLRPESLPNGSEVDVQAVWISDDEERFAGDMIFLPSEGHYWIPERDLEVLYEITREQWSKMISK